MSSFRRFDHAPTLEQRMFHSMRRGGIDSGLVTRPSSRLLKPNSAANNYLSYVQPSVVRKGGGRASVRSDLPVVPAPEVAGEQDQDQLPNEGSGNASGGFEASHRRISRYVENRQRELVSQAWRSFEQGDYIGACRLFSMAESISPDRSETRAYVTLGLLYANLAAEQYSQALRALSWLIEPDPKTGEFRNTQVLNRVGWGSAEGVVRDIRTLYWANPAGVQPDVNKHRLALETFVKQRPDVPALRSLYAIWLWGTGDRQQAFFQMRGVSQDVMWARLTLLMQEAQNVEPEAEVIPREEKRVLPALAAPISVSSGE